MPWSGGLNFCSFDSPFSHSGDKDFSVVASITLLGLGAWTWARVRGGQDVKLALGTLLLFLLLFLSSFGGFSRVQEQRTCVLGIRRGAVLI